MCLDLISISESYIHIIQQYRILFLLTWKYFLPLSLLDKSMSVIQNILQVSKSLAAAGEAQHELLYLSFFPPFTLKLGRNTILCRNKTNCFLMSAFIGSYWADLDTKGYLSKTNTLPTFKYFKTSKPQYEYVCCLSVVESLEMWYHNRIKCDVIPSKNLLIRLIISVWNWKKFPDSSHFHSSSYLTYTSLAIHRHLLRFAVLLKSGVTFYGD